MEEKEMIMIKWTDTKPTEAGFYWARSNSPNPARALKAHIVDLELRDGELWYYSSCFNRWVRLSDEVYWSEVQFSTRIPEPEQPIKTIIVMLSPMLKQ